MPERRTHQPKKKKRRSVALLIRWAKLLRRQPWGVLLHQQEGKLPLITFKHRDSTEAWHVQHWTGTSFSKDRVENETERLVRRFAPSFLKRVWSTRLLHIRLHLVQKSWNFNTSCCKNVVNGSHLFLQRFQLFFVEAGDRRQLFFLNLQLSGLRKDKERAAK